jgi:predicted DNA-binding ribbon-helix-helix protein
MPNELPQTSSRNFHSQLRVITFQWLIDQFNYFVDSMHAMKASFLELISRT